jgi:hypothetical protein
LDSDKAVYAAAWKVAEGLQANFCQPGHSRYQREASFGLMHAIASKLRIPMELAELVEKLEVKRVVAPISRLFTLFWLQAILNADVECSDAERTAATEPEELKAERPQDASIILVEIETRNRPYGQAALTRLKGELSSSFSQETICLSSPGPTINLGTFNILAITRIYRYLRNAGQSRSAALLMSLPATLYECRTLPYLNSIADRFHERAVANPHDVVVAANIARLPVLFALAGTRSGGGHTAAIETTLTTRLRRYPSFAADGHFVIDRGQAALLRNNAGVRACGSVLIEARTGEINRLEVTPPRIVIASQPSDREMRHIMTLAAHLPHTAEIRIIPHAEDGEGFRQWLSKMLERLSHPQARLVDSAEDPLNSASVLITATSNLAIVAQALEIPTVLVAARRDLSDIWEEGPYPGIWVDPEEDGASQFIDAVQRALSGELSQYRKINEELLQEGVVGRIAAELRAPS